MDSKKKPESYVLSATSVAKRTLRMVGLISGWSLQQSWEIQLDLSNWVSESTWDFSWNQIPFGREGSKVGLLLSECPENRINHFYESTNRHSSQKNTSGIDSKLLKLTWSSAIISGFNFLFLWIEGFGILSPSAAFWASSENQISI